MQEKEIKSIHHQMQRCLDTLLTPESCQQCCLLLKRIKESIMKYRNFL